MSIGLIIAPITIAQTDPAPPKPTEEPATPAIDPATGETQPTTTPEAPAITEPSGETAAHPEAVPDEAAPRIVKDPKTYQLWVLAPAIIAIILAVFTRQVVPALVVGVIVGAYMMVPCLALDSPYADMNPVVGGFRLAAEKYVLGPILDKEDGYGNAKIIMFTMFIGFMVGVLGRNGGTTGMVKLVTGKTESPRRSGLTAWLAGLVVFFDDYANTMIIGPTMRSVFDRVKMSRAKLAYIVDSTAAPVASIALIGTWVGAEIGFIKEGLDSVTAKGAPAFLVTDQGSVMTAMHAFIASIPYRFYPILALFLVFLIAWTRRDFGPMKRSEENALSGQDEHPYDPRIDQPGDRAPKPRWWLGLIPVLILVGVTVLLLALTGYKTTDGQNILQRPIPWWEKAYLIINGADPYLSIYYGALLAAIAAMILTIVTRACSVRDASDAGLDGMARMFPAIVILILAWALSGVEQDLMLGKVANASLQAAGFPAVWMPLAIFVCAAVISFATGTSWGTMGILCPAVVTIMAGQAAGLESDKALPLFYAAVGSVLAGAIFGDHCSPISDTTVLSSVASGCRHEDHVWTQIPYALVTALAAMGFGDVMCSVYHQPWYFGLGAGAIFLILVVLIFGRQAKPTVTPPTPQPIPPGRLREPAPSPVSPPLNVARRADDPSWEGPTSNVS